MFYTDSAGPTTDAERKMAEALMSGQATSARTRRSLRLPRRRYPAGEKAMLGGRAPQVDAEPGVGQSRARWLRAIPAEGTFAGTGRSWP